MIQVAEFHANSLNKFIGAYLSKYFNALMFFLNDGNMFSKLLTDQLVLKTENKPLIMDNSKI